MLQITRLGGGQLWVHLNEKTVHQSGASDFMMTHSPESAATINFNKWFHQNKYEASAKGGLCWQIQTSQVQPTSSPFIR